MIRDLLGTLLAPQAAAFRAQHALPNVPGLELHDGLHGALGQKPDLVGETVVLVAELAINMATGILFGGSAGGDRRKKRRPAKPSASPGSRRSPGAPREPASGMAPAGPRPRRPPRRATPGGHR